MNTRQTYRRIAQFAGALLLLCSLGWAQAATLPLGAAPPITLSFDHLTTGFELDGVHRDLACESCHLNAVFKGTPRDCGTCHSPNSIFNATPKTQTHISSSNNCAACHNTISFRPAVHVDHTEVMSSCVSCHNNAIAQGKGPTHPATNDSCASCHSTLSWNPPISVDHKQIPLAAAGFCIICHNGTQASGKPANHIATTLECGDCHLTNTWLTATFNHTGVTSGCFSCHDGVKAVGKQGTHMPTSNVCENCHTTGLGSSTPSWAPAGFDHAQMTVTTCQTCHSGTVKITTGFVSGQPTNHVPPIPSSVDCGVCHGNTPAAETWTVIAVSIPTLHSGLNVNNCTLCHAGQTFAGVPAPYRPMSTSGVSPTHTTPLAPAHIPVLVGSDCSACHSAAYLTGGFGPATAMTAAKHAFVSGTCITCHEAGRSFYVGSGAALQLRPADHTAPNMAAPNDCSNCHTTTDWTSTTLPAGHMPNPGNQACTVCHVGLPVNYTTLAANPVLHTGITSGCAQCHGATATLTFYNNYPVKSAALSPAHIPFLAGADCSSCHTSSTFAVGGFAGMAMTAATHAFVSTSCDVCHEAGLSFYPGASLSLQGRPADHTASTMVAPNDCNQCHTTANWNSTVLPPGHMPNPGNQACTVCHVGLPANFTTLAANPVLHTGITSGCAQCHGATATLTFYNNYPVKSAALSPAHIPFLAGADCSSCHTSSTFAVGGFAGMTMTSATHAFVSTSCDTCHESGLSFYPGAALNLQGRPADHTTGTMVAPNDCNLCHTTVNWNSTALPANHLPNPGGVACATCHTTATAGVTDYTQYSLSGTHSGAITGSCAVCHSGASWVGAPTSITPKSAVGLSPAHIPVLAGADCSKCHVTTGIAIGGFAGMTMTSATHAFVSTSCDTCHESGLSFYPGAALNLQGRPADHTTGTMVAPNDCNLCHTTANWNSTALPAGHMPNPANQACATCHTAAPTNYTTLAANSVLHTGITAACAQCHGSLTTTLTFYNNFTVKSGVLSPVHIPILTGTDCSSCHSSTTYAVGGFAGMTMTAAKHAFVATTCDTCHEAGLTFYPGAALGLQGRPADHTTGTMVAPNDCNLCHTTANWNSTALPSGHMPNPANQACATCHTTAPADYTTTTLAANAVLHTGITTGCIACHGAPNATPPVFYPSYTPKTAVLSPVHIPTSSTACEACHSTTSFAVGGFSGTTMTSAKHTSMFAVIGKTCDACHNKVTPALSFYGVTNLQTRPSDHSSGSKSTNDCSGCHGTSSWGGGAQVKAVAKATAAPSTIASVVNGTARAVGNNLVAPSALRGALVSVGPSAATAGVVAPGAVQATSAGPVAAAVVAPAVSHVGVVSNCYSCHNGQLATGKGSRHIASNNMCENCHTTLAWLPARFDHRGVTAPCASCHNGALAVGKPVRHIPTLQTCDTCHGTLAWLPVTYSHVGISATCMSCHDGRTAVGKPLQHVPTALDCGSCHNTISWNAMAPNVNLKPLVPGLRRRISSAPPQ